ncbi:MAG TPA: OsmC family protein [Sulfurovum sp.]|jgi:putative redox protein|nr:MAG: osmotically inducible protein OsmC [Sulfurovum sp. 35-42-20]OYY56338.1 MAG: osmotically inducible protein OsmC [Sulfurovum sp. 28-43-6]OYZ25452.1 MAG: osmotically inducible protein OsmC [Sulfurovum sp. 16-42-52]OYZ48465.1 MAG: osmotically inducible protein OsmC [Sulfurovum sp. 24-42-9]OZA45421.1 MAG: osmotically inducible protein OsmC [Sulfurovum sp. 17-42-90]OZA61061.1 MAG: osmotically inducible protein OsmC [Sulfurovum sp. 39-42-12]HQR74324.1 OsmC family protein [Sulfurovum sp.]
MEVSVEYRGDKTFKANTLKSSFILDCKEITPVEYFATGIIGCTGIDLVMMAEKDGFEVRNYTVKAEIERSTSVPMKFVSMHIIYDFEGDFDAIKAKRYIGASLESYCTTVNSIRDSVQVRYTVIQNGEVIVENEALMSMKALQEDGFGGACCS